jgi:hypothetical protein
MLSDVIANVAQRLDAAGVSTPVLIGRRWLPQSNVDSSGRIVVIPNDDSFGAGATQTFNGLGARQRMLMTRRCGAEVHIWGVPADPTAPMADLEAMAVVEALLHAFLRELRAITRGQLEVGPGRWNNDGGYDLIYGAEYIVQILVDVPVTDVARETPPQGSGVQTAFGMGSTSEA